jgi:hypothetical protein
MSEKSKTLPQELGVENDDAIIDQCLEWQISENDISSILKKIMCSNYNSKEMLFAAYVIGKMQNSSQEHMKEMVMHLTLKNLKKLIDNGK